MALHLFPRLVFALTAISASAAVVWRPQDLSPGDTYRIIFFTDGVRDATSSNIEDYNEFVSNAANSEATLAALGTTWKALASTQAMNALTNAGLSQTDSTTRFYNTIGQLIATGILSTTGTTLYGPDTSHGAEIFDQHASIFAPLPYHVWTGTDRYGTAYLMGGLGTPFPFWGFRNERDYSWTHFYDKDTRYPMEYGFALHGVSGVLTVPAEVPELRTFTMIGMGAALAMGFSMIRKRHWIRASVTH